MDSRQPFEDLEALMNELLLYNPDLARKPALVFANKYDLSSEF